MAHGRRRYTNNGQDKHEESQEATRLMNSGARADIIRSAAQYIADREAEIKMIRGDITEYKQKHIKGDLGFKLSDWSTVYRTCKLETEGRDQLLDTIREGFAALDIGQSVDWVQTAAASAPPASGYDDAA